MEFLQEEFDEILEIFRVESEEIVERFNNNLLSLEKTPQNQDIIMELFRDAHSIKGASRMIGFNNIQNLAHRIEDILGLAKDKQMLIDKSVSSEIYKVTDYISYLIQESVKEKKEVVTPDLNEHLANLQRIIEANSTDPPLDFLKDAVIHKKKKKNTNKKGDLEDDTSVEDIDNLIKKVAQDTFESGLSGKTDQIKRLRNILNKEKFDATSIKVILDDIPLTLIDQNMLAVAKLILQILDKLKAEKNKPNEETMATVIDSINSVLQITAHEKNNEDILLIEQKLKVTLEMLDIMRSTSVTTEVEKKIEADIKPELQQAQNFFKTYETGAIKTLRVDTQKLDQLVNQIGELIISKMKTKSHLVELEKIKTKLEDWYSFSYKSINYIKYYDKKISNKFEEEDVEGVINFTRQILHLYEESSIKIFELNQNVSQLYRQIQDDDVKFSHIVDDLENMVKNVRVLPLATVFHMFPRMVRDISTEKHKEVELFISGSETSADKKIIEEIKTPLIHILRNAIDHGIETAAERRRLNKPAVGKIELNARHIENKIIIEVIDDGQGVDLDKIKEKALDKGLLTKDEIESMNNVQLMNLIFWPGFSTEESITELSGRGVGLDIVQTKISQLNGSVKVFSKLGEGSRVLIELPITMATLKSFIVSIQKQIFAIPMSAIKTVIWVDDDDIFLKDGQQAIIHNNETVTIFDLARVLSLLNKEEIPVKKRTVVIVEQEGVVAGYIVDKLFGDQEILHKKLSPPIYKIKNISGITTLASGEVCLILNVSDLLKSSFDSPVDAQLIRSINDQRKNSIKAKKHNHKILIVDDSITTRTLLKNILLSSGYDFKLANNPIEAMKRMAYDVFDLIITDIEMPQMNGWEFCKYLRNDEEYAKKPIIVLTSVTNDDTIQQAKQLEVNSYISKSQFNQESFIEIMDQLLK